MKIKLSATFEGRCDICKNEGTVFTAGDEDTKKVVTVCHECADRLNKMKTSEVIERYGHEDKKPFENGVKIERKADAS